MNVSSHPPFSDISAVDLTISQRRIWTGQMLFPDKPLYNMAMAFQIERDIVPSVFSDAFQKVIDENDALRTIFIERNGVPSQKIVETLQCNTEFIDLSDTSSPAETADELIDQRARTQFKLDEQLFDSVLFKLRFECYVWFINQHHLICDAWSCAVLHQRLSHCYQLALDNRLDEAEPTPQFRDYRVAEKNRRQEAEGIDAAHYWSEKFTYQRSELELYGRRVDPLSTATFRISCDIGLARSEKLRALARISPIKSISEDLSLYYLFSTLLFVYIHRVSGQHNLVIGSPSHNRSQLSEKQTLGLFVELFPLQLTIKPGDTFRTLAESIIPEVNQLLRHALPGASSEIPGDAYSVVLNYLNVEFGDFSGMNSRCSWIHSGFGDRGHALRLQVHDFNGTGSFTLLFDLHEETFPPSIRAHVAGHFLNLMDALLEDLDTCIDRVCLLSGSETEILVKKYNDTTTALLPAQTILELFKEQVDNVFEATAIVENDSIMSYGQLDELSGKVALHLKRKGISSEDSVAVYMDRSESLIVSLLAIMKAGAAFVPIDTSFPEQRLAYVLEDSGCKLVLTSTDLKPNLPEVTAAIFEYNHFCQDIAAGDLQDLHLEEVDARSLAYMIYTSGSTGRPKGVMIEHRSLFNYLCWARNEYMEDGPHDFPLFTSVAADLTITSLFLPLISGSTVVVYPESITGPDLSVMDVFSDDRVDIIKLTPSHLALLESSEAPPARLKKLIVGGENFKSSLAGRISNLYGGNITIYNEYGPTEATIGCMIYRFDPNLEDWGSVAIGRPIDNLRIYLLDAALNPVPVGVKGDLYIAGTGLARGYHNEDEMTAEKFVADPFQPGEKMYYSGDIGRWRCAGVMDYLGRDDDQVKVRGYRIERGEIEAAIGDIDGIGESFCQVVEHGRPATENFIARCRACGLPANVPKADLDENEICAPCRNFENQRQLAEQYFKSENELHLILEQAKHTSRGRYDCLMQYSGGKDSTYALYKLVEMGMRPLVFSFDNGFIPESAKDNVRRIVEDLGLDLHWGVTPAMNDIFVDSLRRFSNVCNGCQKVINTMSISLACEHDIEYIVTGLSRGQSFATRVADLLSIGVVDSKEIDEAVLEARKAYHRMDDAVNTYLDVSVFNDESVFERVQFIDFYRYWDVPLADVLEFLNSKTPWTRPADTGRSTNCIINEAGIYIHKKERGYHNYAAPYSWDVRLGHKQRDSALKELEDDIDEVRVQRMLKQIGYDTDEKILTAVDRRIVAYYVGEREFTPEELRASLLRTLPAYMIPAYFLRMESFPLNAAGKVDHRALPLPGDNEQTRVTEYRAPRTAIEESLAKIWERVLGVEPIGIYDNFFDLGGDSILNIQIVSRAGKAGIRITPGLLFQNQTIAELAETATSAEPAAVSYTRSPVDSEAEHSPYPLTPLQAGMLFHTLKEPASGVYVEQYLCTISGRLDLGLFQKTWESLVQQHPVLRTSFIWDNPDQPLQKIHNDIALSWHIESLQDKSVEEISEYLENYLETDRNKGFRLSEPPLMRFALFKIGEDSYRWIWSFHHVICDGWSTTQLIAELITEYHSLSEGVTAFQSPERSFRDYVSWIHEQDLDAAEHFWKKELEGFSSPTPLPTKSFIENQKGYGREERCFSDQSTASLITTAQAKRLTLNTIIQGAWAVLLHRYSGEEDIIFGTTVSGRPPSFQGAETMIGLFINTLPVRVMIEHDRPLSEWLAGLMSKQVDARSYEYTSLINVQEWSECKPGVSLFESIVVFENVQRHPQLNERQWDFAIENIQYLENSNFPISIIALPGECLRIVAFYNREYFSHQGVTQLLNHLYNIIQAFIEDPDQKVESLPLLSAEEFELLAKWQSGTEVELSGSTVQNLFEKQAFSQPSMDAVICQSERSSYSEINKRANRLAHYLLEQEFPPATYHGIYLDRSIDMVIAMLAVLKSGATYVPLDPGYPESRIAYMLSDAMPATILTVDRLAGELPNSQSQVICLNDQEPRIEQFSDANPNISVELDDLAYVIYTSGSTGDPKGVMITHRNLSNSTEQRIRYYREQPARFLLLSSISFDSSVAGIFGTLCQGGSLYIPEQDKHRDVGYLADIINKESITQILAIPSLYQNLLDYYAPAVHSLKTVIVAGESCSHNLVEKHWSTFPNTRLFNEYGPTEATVWSSVFDCSNEYMTNSVPIGRPIGNMQLYVLDRWLRQVPPGIAGELYLGGDSVSLGYLNQPELTSEQFICLHLPNKQEQRLYKSGDVACFLDDGNLQFLGRTDEQIKMRGYRIELGEIESALKRIRNIYQAVVVPQGSPEVHSSSSVKPVSSKPSSVSGLAAYIEFYPGDEIESEMVKSSLAKVLPDYLIPNDIVVMDSLPLNLSGKIDRRQLSKPNMLKSKDLSSKIEPRSVMEKNIAKMWREILDIDQISMSDNFFELGGHSLMAVRLFAMIKNLTDLDLPLATLFTSPTLKDFVEHINQELDQYPSDSETDLPTGTTPTHPNPDTHSKRVVSSDTHNRWNVVVPIRKEGTRPPLFLLHSLLGNVLNYSAMIHLDAKQPVYALQAVGLDGFSEPIQDLQKMLEHYVIELQKVQPHGPYLLGGWSVGGVLALELAHLLQKKGEHVIFLGMFDSVVPDESSLPTPKNRPTKKRVTGSKPMGKTPSSPVKSKIKYLPNPGILSRFPIRLPNNSAASIFSHIVNISMCRVCKILGKARPDDLRRWYLLYSHLTALKSFKPKEYNIQISYFRSAISHPDDRPDCGWGEFTPEGVDVINVSTEKVGNKFLKSPEFIVALDTCLKDIYSRNKTPQ